MQKLKFCECCGKDTGNVKLLRLGLCNKCYYKNHRKGYYKEYHLKNRRKIIDKTAKWRKDNPQRNFLMRQKYREKNKETIRKKKRNYQQKNWDRIKKHDTTYKNNRKKYDIEFRIKCNLRLRLYHLPFYL